MLLAWLWLSRYNPIPMTHPSSSLASATAQLPKASIGKLRHIRAYLLPYRMAIAGACVALIFTSSAVLGMGAALRYLVDAGIASGNLALLDTYYWRLLVVVAVLAAATYARYYLVSWVGERVVADIRRDVYGKIISMHTAYFEITRTGDLLSRITTDTTLLQNVVGSSISIFLRNLLLFFGGATMLLITSQRLAEYVALLLPLVIIPIIVIGKKVRALSRQTQDRVGDIAVHAEETLGAMRTIQAMSLETFEVERFAGYVNEARRIAIKRIAMRAALTAIVIMLVFGAVVTVLWIGGRDMIAGTISAGDLSAFIFYAVVVAGSLGAISEVVGELQRAAGAAERLMELMQLQPEIIAPDDAAHLPEPLQGKVVFDRVVFHYPSRPDSAALSDISLTIEPGQTVALVGPSGAGKTTMFQLLLRFYDPKSGSIRIDGVPIDRLAPQELRRAMGFVPQDPAIFSASARDNIRCGLQTADDAAIIQAATMASADAFIRELPQGYDTYLGEKGVRLSGGQRQRIAIARAMIREPKILLLDEATSALDSESERQIQAALETIREGRTTLVIAHRLSTVLCADVIAVMNEGRIEATGSHAQLLESSPLYKHLAQLQFGV